MAYLEHTHYRTHFIVNKVHKYTGKTTVLGTTMLNFVLKKVLRLDMLQKNDL